MSSEILAHDTEISSGPNVINSVADSEIDELRSSMDYIPETQNDYSETHPTRSKMQNSLGAVATHEQPKETMKAGSVISAHSDVSMSTSCVDKDPKAGDLHARLDLTCESQPTSELTEKSSHKDSTEPAAMKFNGELGRNPETKKSVNADQSDVLSDVKYSGRKHAEPGQTELNIGEVGSSGKMSQDGFDKSNSEKMNERLTAHASKSDEIIVADSDKSQLTVAPSPRKGILKKRKVSPLPPEREERDQVKPKVEQFLEDAGEDQSTKKRGKRKEASESLDPVDGVGRHSLRVRTNQSPSKSETPKKEVEKEREKRRQKSASRDMDAPTSHQKRARSTSSATQESDSSITNDDLLEKRQRRNKYVNKADERMLKSKMTLSRDATATSTSKSTDITLSPRMGKTKTSGPGGKTKTKADHASRVGGSAMATASRGNKTPSSRSSSGKKVSPAGALRLYDSDDFDDTAESSASILPPLKHVHVARGAFNDIKFTKAEEEVTSLKYVCLSKSVEERRSQVFKSPQSTPSLKFSSSSELKSTSDSLKKSRDSEISKKRASFQSSLSPGQWGDISSFDSKATNSTMPRSTQSSGGRKVSSELSSDEKNSPAKSKKSPKKSGEMFVHADDNRVAANGRKLALDGHKRSGSAIKSTPVLFSDVEQKICDDFDAEDFLDRSKSSGASSKKSSAASRRKRQMKKRDVGDGGVGDEMDEVQDDEEADDLKVVKVAESPARKSLTMVAKRTRDIDRSSISPSPIARKKRTPQVQALTPKRKEPELQKFSPEEQLICDFPTDHHLLPGARVLAKWVDNYYPGNIVLSHGLGRYKVKFLDGVYRDMPQPDIIPLASLQPGSTLMLSVKTEDGEDELQPVTIINTPSATNSQEWYDGLFEVHNSVTQDTEKALWERFIIDSDQRKMYVASLINIAAQDITADNISQSRVRINRGKRAESAEQPPSAVTTPTVTSSAARVSRTPKPKRPASTKTPRRAVRPRPSENVAMSATDEGFEDRNGIFAGSKFVLTSANRVKSVKDSAESSEEEKSLVPFNKKQVRQMIDERGGQVVEDFGTLGNTNDCFLIADQYYRTHKYLSALARAVPCISHVWVHDCVNASQKLPHKNYILPAGQSLETNQIVEWHQECPRLLAGLNVFVYTQNRPTNPGALDFVQIWAPLVKCMGATLLTDLPDPDQPDARLDILLTDVSCPDDVLGQAVELGANAVSSEWLIQAIITGSRPEPVAHPKYRYDYVEQNVGGSTADARPTVSG